MLKKWYDQQLVKLRDDHSEVLGSSNTVKQGIEVIQSNIKWMESNPDEIAVWLGLITDAPTMAPTMAPTTTYPTTVRTTDPTTVPSTVKPSPPPSSTPASNGNTNSGITAAFISMLCLLICFN